MEGLIIAARRSSPLPTGEGGTHRESDGRVRAFAACSGLAPRLATAATTLTPTLSRRERERERGKRE
jgi:hypothetical protein